MQKWALSILALLALMIAAACQPTGDTREDSASAQNLMPSLPGYNQSDADSIVDAVAAAGAGASLTSGNVPLAATVYKAEAIVECLQDVGAVSAQTYVQNQPTEIIPNAGFVLVLNTTRLNRNLLNCLTTGQTGTFSAQAVTIEPCTGSGEFAFNGEDFSYLYIGVGDNICPQLEQHFGNLQGSG